jgi:hypothetical protein
LRDSRLRSGYLEEEVTIFAGSDKSMRFPSVRNKMSRAVTAWRKTGGLEMERITAGEATKKAGGFLHRSDSRYLAVYGSSI